MINMNIGNEDDRPNNQTSYEDADEDNESGKLPHAYNKICEEFL